MTMLYGVLLLKRSLRPGCYRNVLLLLTLSDGLKVLWSYYLDCETCYVSFPLQNPKILCA